MGRATWYYHVCGTATNSLWNDISGKQNFRMDPENDAPFIRHACRIVATKVAADIATTLCETTAAVKRKKEGREGRETLSDLWLCWLTGMVACGQAVGDVGQGVGESGWQGGRFVRRLSCGQSLYGQPCHVAAVVIVVHAFPTTLAAKDLRK